MEKLLLCIAYASIYFIIGCCQGAQLNQPPHLIFIVCDDCGWNEMEWQNPLAQTPRSAELVRDGVLLSHAYVYKFCAPTRASMLSGRYPWHTVQRVPDGEQVCQTDSNGTCHNGIQLSYTLMPKMLKRSKPDPYISYLFGKWHQGFYANEYTPFGRGFDHSFGVLSISKHDHWNDRGIPAWTSCSGIDLWDTNAPPTLNTSGTHMADVIAAKATKVIENHGPYGPPIYMHVAFTNMRHPIQEEQKWIEVQNPNVTNQCRRTTQAMSTHIDYVIGQIIDSLKSSEMYHNSIIVFTTDNGGQLNGAGHDPSPGHPQFPACGNNWPLRGGKFSLWEGGVRGVAFVHSPLLPQNVRGTTYKGLVHSSDWYTTFAALANISTEDTGPINVDGVNLWPVLSGKTNTDPRKEALLAAGNTSRQGLDQYGGLVVRHNSSFYYKLIIGKQDHNGWQSLPNNTFKKASYNCGSIGKSLVEGPCIFNLALDPNERIDITRNSTEAKTLIDFMISRYRALTSIRIPHDPVCTRDQCPDKIFCEVTTKRGGYYGPFAKLPATIKSN